MSEANTHCVEYETEPLLISGTISRFTYFNDQTGFGVGSIKTLREDSKDSVSSETLGSSCDSDDFGCENETSRAREFILVGVYPHGIQLGSYIIARGSWETHPRFGLQFKARHIAESRPPTPEAIVRYLSSSAIEGIGPFLAERIVECFGVNTFQILDNNPKALLKVSGIGEKKLAEITANWQTRQGARDLAMFFQTYNIGTAVANRIIRTFGQRAVEMVQKDPYILAHRVSGIGFLTADKIANSLGIPPNSNSRFKAALTHIMLCAEDDGHTYLPVSELISRTAHLLETDNPAMLQDMLQSLVLEQMLAQIEDRVYLPSLLSAELQIARTVADRLLVDSAQLKQVAQSEVDAISQSPLCINPNRAHSLPTYGHLSPEQVKALNLVASHPLVVITGGPGCGKTTIIRALVHLFQRAGLELRLAAPTGRAAQRMSEVTNHSASTIHRLLRFDPIHRTFIHDAGNPLEIDALILDESSMLDLPLANSLLSALPLTARIVIVGDADQLPSVGPGMFLADLLESAVVPKIVLSQLFRRAEDSRITSIAHQINSGRCPAIPAPDGKTKSEAYFIQTDDAPATVRMIERLYTSQIPKKFGISSENITVLSPMNQGELGIVALNKHLQGCLNAQAAGLPSLKVGDLTFRMGDRVCQRVNNYQLSTGVFNGDQGKIIGIDTSNKGLVVRLWDGREVNYTTEDLDQLDLAYAITVHRSQGSEIPAVILVVHPLHTMMLERQLVYTAVTRAKALLVVVGKKSSLEIACRRLRSRHRYSSLKSSIKKALGETICFKEEIL